MLYKKLQNAGLSETEARIYVASLELGETSVSRIARKAGIKRTTAYLSLDNLMEKGLMSSIKKEGKINYFAEDPRSLERIMDEKKQIISKIIPELLTFINLFDKKPTIRYFEGTEGIKEVFKDTLNYSKQEICTMYSESYASDFDEKFFYEYYVPERVARKISARAIFPDNKQMRALAITNEKSLRQSKFIPQNIFNIKIEIVIYGNNKVSMVSFKEKFAFIIESQMIHKSLKSIFETIWASAK